MANETLLCELSFNKIRSHYDQRFTTHQELKRALENNDVKEYVPLALGISDARGNYSANEHGLGPRILSESSPEQVFNVASRLFECSSANEVLSTIYNANLPYLKVSVGSEMSMMLHPEIFWVTNVRTIWAYLLVRHHWHVELANEELDLYREQDKDSEMHYDIWRDLHFIIEPYLRDLANLGNAESTHQNVEPGELTYLWADAIADSLYVEFT